MDAHLWCTCPKICFGRRWVDAAEYLETHRHIDVRPHEVSIQVYPDDNTHDVTSLVFKGVTDEDHRPLEVLVQVYLDDGVAEVSYRRNKFDTWSAPDGDLRGGCRGAGDPRRRSDRHPSAR